MNNMIYSSLTPFTLLDFSYVHLEAHFPLFQCVVLNDNGLREYNLYVIYTFEDE